MQSVRLLIEHHGDLFYFITFLWTAMEGETFVIFAGLAAQKGMLNIWALFLAAWAGTFCGDQLFFYIGRRFGTRLIARMPRFKKPVRRALAWITRHAVAFILSYRFMYGVRNISGIAIGMSDLPWRTFAFWNAIAGFIWAAAFSGAGYIFGDVIRRLRHRNQVIEDSVHQVTLSVLGLFLLIILFRLGITWLQNRRRKPKVALTPKPPEILPPQ